MDEPKATSRTPIASFPVEITISVGKARPYVHELLALEENAILPLDSKIDDPVELFIGEQLIARGDLQELPEGKGGQLAVRLTHVMDVATSLA